MYHAVLAHVLSIGNRNGAWLTIQPFSLDHPNDPNVGDIQTRTSPRLSPQITTQQRPLCPQVMVERSIFWERHLICHKKSCEICFRTRRGWREPIWALNRCFFAAQGSYSATPLIPKKCKGSWPTSGGWWRQIDWLDPQSLKEYWPHFDESQDLNVDISRTDKHHWKESETIPR